jgi:NAD(P)H-dependent FMN reductase
MKSSTPEILVIAGTVREGRQSDTVARWYLDRVRVLAPELSFSFLDVAELNLPVFGESTPPLYGRYSPTQAAIAQRIAAADGFVFVTGEYNRSIPGSLKNFLDYVYAEWNRKPAALVTYGGSGGGVRAAEHLTQVLSNLGVPVLREQLSVPLIWAAINSTGINPEAVRGEWKAHVDELTWWVRALQTARADQLVGV